MQTRRFGRQYKKLHDNVVEDVDSAVQSVAGNPKTGERKKGDLAALRVHLLSRNDKQGIYGVFTILRVT